MQIYISDLICPYWENMILAIQPSFGRTDFRRPLEKDGFWAAVLLY